MTFWRAAGLTYVNYSTIAARCTRQALKKGVDVGTIIMELFGPNKAFILAQCWEESHYQRQVPDLGEWEAGGEEAVSEDSDLILS